MDQLLKNHFALIFPFYFCLLWLAVTTILATRSGWFALQARFPVRPAQVLQKLSLQSAAMSKGAGKLRVNYNAVLTITICVEGLQIDMLRIFGPACRAFFVPWEDITFTPRKTVFGTVTDLSLGAPVIATFTARRRLAERIRAAGAEWRH